jgi:hypothetical protein
MDAPAVAVTSDGKRMAAAWMDTRAGGNNRDVQWTVIAGGRASPETTVHDAGQGTQGHPSLVFDGEGTLWCAWEDSRGGPNSQRIYVADSKSRQNVPLSEPAEGKCGYPSLAAGGGVVGAAYESNGGISFRLVTGN